MRVAVVGLGLVFAMSGCRCLASVDETTADAGLSGDGGVLSRDGGALTDDGGSLASDGGVLSVDGGALSIDGGALDSGSPITDAGPSSVDAGTTSRDAGPGASDAGTPIAEVCDGIDNDLDGLIDDAPDGAVLSRDCPLSLGVCADIKSPCVDGGYQACDYGPNYQLTEHKCDGLDNDCDGRVDKSWVRTLPGATNGLSTPFWYGLTNHQQLIRVSERFILNLPGSVLELDDDLRITRRISFPRSTQVSLGFGMSRLFPADDGDGWQRIILEDTDVDLCVEVHRLFADAGYPTRSNGDLEFTAQRCPGPRHYLGYGPVAAISKLGRVVKLDEVGSAIDDAGAGYGRYYPDLLDGGAAYTSFGTGFPWPLGYRSVSPYRDGFILAWSSSPASVTRIDECGSPFVCVPIATLPRENCSLAAVDPLVFSCISTTNEVGSDWLFGDGGVIQTQLPSTNPIVGQMDPLGRPFATQDTVDTNGKPSGFALVEVTKQGLFEYERLLIPGSIKGLGLAPLDHELHLLMWSDQMPDPDPNPFVLSRFNAEYLCLP